MPSSPFYFIQYCPSLWTCGILQVCVCARACARMHVWTHSLWESTEIYGLRCTYIIFLKFQGVRRPVWNLSVDPSVRGLFPSIGASWGKEVNSKSCLKMRKCTGYNSVVIRWLPFFGVDISLSSANQRICKPHAPDIQVCWVSCLDFRGIMPCGLDCLSRNTGPSLCEKAPCASAGCTLASPLAQLCEGSFINKPKPGLRRCLGHFRFLRPLIYGKMEKKYPNRVTKTGVYFKCLPLTT